MKSIVRLPLLTACLALPALVSCLSAQVPQLINYQGRVVVAGTNFGGAGQFKFALVNSNGIPTFWSNNGTSVNGSEPGAAVSLTVANGLYSVLLGDATVANMTVIPATVFTNADVRLRVWFNGGSGFQLLTPDQRIAAVGYAMMAANVPDGIITAAKLADGAVTSNKLADGAVTGAKISAGTITSNALSSSLGLGSSSVDGTLNVYRNNTGTPGISLFGGSSQISTYGDDGLEQIRLHGVGWGELLLHDNTTNNATTVQLSAHETLLFPIGASSPGGALKLNQGTTNRIYLKAGASGGQMTLYQIDGQTGVFLDGDSSGSGLIQLRSTNGSTRINLYGKSPDSGSGEVSISDDDGTEVVELRGNGNGGQLTLKDDTGTRNTAFLGSSSVGGYEYLYNANGNICVYMTGDSGGAGYVSVRNTNGSTKVELDGYSSGGGGRVSVYDTSGTETVQIIGAESSTEGGQILMRNGAGVNTVQLDSDASGVHCGYLALYTSNGVASIIMDAAGSGDGRITTQVLQITGGSDLSENFDIRADRNALQPGMIVSIDPANVGELTLSQNAYDKRVAGIVSGAGGVRTGMLMGQAGTKADGKHPVALTGRVYCWVDADAAGAVEPGDLITTSNTAGHGMKVANHQQAQGAIIGKAMSSLDKGKGLVLVLVSLQ